MRQLATRILALIMVSAALIVQALAAAPAYADGETGGAGAGPGVDVLLVSLVLAAAAVALSAFAAGILWWERHDPDHVEHGD